MSESLEHTLKNLARMGTLVKDRGYRQIWRFEQDNRAYYLKFYPRGGWWERLRRIFRGNPALREFLRLQWLQKASIPAPRAVATLVGYRLDDRLGDAVILEAIEPSVPLDRHLNDLLVRGERIDNRRELAAMVRSLAHQLGRAKLGHSDLHLGNFLLSNEKLHLIDAYAVHRGGLRMRDLQLLAHSARAFATKTDIQRAWEQLGDGGKPPRQNPLDARQWHRTLRRITREDRYFGQLRADNWRGHFFKRSRYAQRWSSVSRMHITGEDWKRAWPLLWKQIESDQLTVIKRSPSGDVLEGEVILGGRPIGVIVKRPRRKLWHRFLIEMIRPGRARRAWTKAWRLVVRDIPTAWPMLLMEKRAFGYVTDALIVFEKIPAKSMNHVDLDSMTRPQRDLIFHRMGRLLRRLELDGLSHRDTKSSNWMVLLDEKTGPMPLLIDVDGLSGRRRRGKGMQRLLLSMKRHGQYTPADSLALCRGYAPTAAILPDSRPSDSQSPSDPPPEEANPS